jgi:hypothetical protein
VLLGTDKSILVIFDILFKYAQIAAAAALPSPSQPLIDIPE